ncbi:hypothetical protein V5P93_000203 [Actinokineospora auranticolor]|uniref:Uncharacterized protein n=1 Tax=Actinokineospora auranticolor TaxID=155976 RepID=A0A2S6GKY2_9PSEU|nr:hypothetical protein [Actinokineospora auranticolor]PPK65904.1 hypothetical protein CLV40_112169 [Actinokineospora auranticolor]
MATALWIVAAASAAAFIIWRLKHAGARLETIFREERERTEAESGPAEEFYDELDQPHRVGWNRRSR